MCVCFRSWSGLHCVSEGGQSDAGGSSLGGALLLHAAASGTGQSGEPPANHIHLILVVAMVEMNMGVTSGVIAEVVVS